MADSDPISDSTPHKRRKLNDGKAWDSQDDSGDDLTEEDFNTIATLPLHATQERPLRPDIAPDNHTYVTQPTQTLNLNTQPSLLPESLPNTSDVLVEQSSPIRAPSPPKAPPPPIRRAFSSKPGLLASAMAPPGTNYRAPLGVQTKPRPVHIDVDSDEDPPVHHSSDEEDPKRGQGHASVLKRTNFKTRGQGLDSEPAVLVKESPRAPSGQVDTFKNLLSGFAFAGSSSPAKAADDMISAYGSASRRPRPQLPARPSAGAAILKPNAVVYETVDDIHDYVLKKKVLQIKQTLDFESVQRCMDALARCHGHVEDAIAWLTADEEQDAPGEEEIDELASTSPVAKRGVAIAKPSQEFVQPIRRPTAKQEIKVPTLTIAEKYASTQQARRASQPSKADDQSPMSPDDERVKPAQRKRLQQGRKTARSPSPLSSPPVQKPPQPLQRLKKQQPIVIEDDDSESDSGVIDDVAAEPEQLFTESSHDRRLLKFFNECSVADLVDLSAQPTETIKHVLDQRPFESLDVIRTISNVAETTKSGKRSKARPVGDKIVDVCSEMWTGYDAVDDLVEECERIAKPIQDALKGWGVGSGNGYGELQLMNLDEAQDSGIGTPSSSCPGDEAPGSSTSFPKPKGSFLSQPKSMNPDFTLKDFQLVGLNWLNLLWSKKVSCILADDMGLGKTCQVIAFLAHLQQQKLDGVHLVIVPGSTLENWLREFERFAPSLRVVPYYGSQSERRELRYSISEDTEAGNLDVVVTTYDMAQKPEDNSFIRRLEPLVCVFDEAHALRNTQSDRYKQLTRIPATFRILLTGTPLQNNLQELIAILAFIMPNLFKDKREDLEYIFQHKASTKDTDHGALLSAQRIARARTMMTPFILRRKKQQVLELPAKHSRIEYCEMTASQAEYYGSLVQEAQEFYAGTRTARGRNASANMLMALRKAAIHALLSRNIYDDKKIDKMVTELLKHDEFSQNDPQRVKDYLTGDHYQSFKGGDFGLHRFCQDRDYLRKFELKKKQLSDSSGKMYKFRELVRSFVANGDRILVFSQFTSMMDILEAELDEMHVKYSRLDGQTNIQVRQTMLDQFAADETISVFMLSTKAGGAGINLACANKVVIFDSGFNPQDDIQAENRAHRVGQTREVEVVRLVTRGTIEEQIHALGESKVALDERVAGASEGATAAEEKQAEKAGEQIVEKMFLDSLKKQPKQVEREGSGDLKDAFKSGLESAGLRVSSKQAQF